MLPSGLLILLFLFVYACVPQPITDLRPVSVAQVRAADLPPSDALRDAFIERGERIWKIALTGDAGWVREVKKHGLNGYAMVVRCDDRDRRLLSTGPYVGTTLVSAYDADFRSGRLDHVRGSLRYDIYLAGTGRYISERDHNAPMPSYDLNRQGLSLCLRIAGGAMHGAYNRSNEVRVAVGGV